MDYDFLFDGDVISCMSFPDERSTFWRTLYTIESISIVPDLPL